MKTESNPVAAATDFETLVLDILGDGGKKRFDLPYSVIPLFRSGETAGFAYFDGTRLMHTLEIKRVPPGKIEVEWIDSRSSVTILRRSFLTGGTGRRIQSSDLPSGPPEFEPACPMIDLLYRIAFSEHQGIGEGKADLHLIALIERIIRSVTVTSPGFLGFFGGRDPRSWQRLQVDLDRLAASRVHTWKERLSSAKKMKSDYRKILRFKQRIHHSGSVRASITDGWLACTGAIRRFASRPRENLLGILDHLLLDPVRWFGGVVRSNMGYSIALAVYSPFTFFFITQPMNPHAMWAVEKVRNAGLVLFEPGPVASRTETPSVASSEPDGETGWKKRMDQFKSMQIALEAHLDFSKRVGRLEEIETQLAWPITLQGAWDESTRYRQSLDYLGGSAADPTWSAMVNAEKRRLGEIRIYLRDRLLRFILDHRYLILDPGSELGRTAQQARRAITLYSRIHEAILREQPGLPPPPESGKIIALASRTPANDLSEPPFRREERMRYWESLYLMQSRNQESSNTGLQTYWWSVRNTVSVIQMMLATRREEMVLLSLHPRPTARERSAFEDRYRSMLHLLETEYHSIRPELSDSLPGDRESSFREALLTGIREYLAERERL